MGVGNEVDLGRTDDGVSAAAICRELDRYRFVRNQRPSGDQAIKDAGASYRLPLIRKRAVDLAVEDAVAAIDETGGIAE